MSTYLEGYGAGEEKKSKVIRAAIVSTVAVLVLGTFGFFGLRNYGARATFDQFIELLQKKDYTSAYALWGCTPQTPCRDYNMERFLRDWGPDSPAKDAASARVVQRASCGSILNVTGVLRIYQFSPDYTVSLWVDKQDGRLGFAPIIGKMQCTLLP